jgi:hypothetical protein
MFLELLPPFEQTVIFLKKGDDSCFIAPLSQVIRYAFEFLPNGLVVPTMAVDSVPLLGDLRVFSGDGASAKAFGVVTMELALYVAVLAYLTKVNSFSNDHTNKHLLEVGFCCFCWRTRFRRRRFSRIRTRLCSFVSIVDLFCIFLNGIFTRFLTLLQLLVRSQLS